MRRMSASFVAARIATSVAMSALVASAGLAPMSASAADATRAPAGALADGTPVEAITLTGANGVSARVLTYGATLQSLLAPDRHGQLADVVLGHDTPAECEANRSFFGVTVGRYANRIAAGTFTIDGTRITLDRNDHGNSLHGGSQGWDRRVWQVASVRPGGKGVPASVELALHSPDGDGGYPGAVDATVTYALDDHGALTITFAARTSRPTVINMTNHALFNLAGNGAPLGTSGHRLTIPASAITPVDDKLIPTGALQPVAGTAFDFRTPRVVAEALRDARDPQILRGRGYDHNFALDKGLTAEPGLAARLEDPASGRVLELLTTEPGVQFYTGNFLDGTVAGKHGVLYRMGDGIALEPQKFPDSPNQPRFPSARLDPAHPYRHVMVLKLSTQP